MTNKEKPLNFAEIAFPLAVNQNFTYAIPKEFSIAPFIRVTIPFKNKKKVGFVAATHDQKPKGFEVKKIDSLLDEKPLLTQNYFSWLTWASRYYFCPFGEVLASALPSGLFQPLSLNDLCKKRTKEAVLAHHWTSHEKIILNSRQQNVLEELLKLHQSNFVALLHGITGSGKTEVYLRFAEHILQQNRQVLILVPEIGLTPQMIARFRAVFGENISVFHSQLTENQRLKEWLKTQRGEINLMIGTRSALFAPFNNLGVIIVDEEHDSSYKQQERFRYHARDLAIVRGKIENFPVILGSATPSLESFNHAKEGKYLYFHLPERAGLGKPPQIQLIDMAALKRQSNSPLILSPPLRKAIEENLEKKEQTLILMNRRGFASSAFCLGCQQVITCLHCSVSMTYHKTKGILRCHYCDAGLPLPKKCPHCHENQITLLGFGTQTIEEELATSFSKARITRLDRDSTQKKGTLVKILKQLKDHQIDILVGTQMLAKGHDIFRVTLVGVVGIDAGLYIPDFRASERSFQLLMQVAGRAGRGSLPGKVLVQSFAPQHYSIQLACNQNYEAFFDQELKLRKELGYPPLGRLIQFRFFSPHQNELKNWIFQLEKRVHLLKKKLPLGVVVLGPAPTFIEKLRGKFYWQLLLKAPNSSLVQQAAYRLMDDIHLLEDKRIKWNVDVDPIDMV